MLSEVIPLCFSSIYPVFLSYLITYISVNTIIVNNYVYSLQQHVSTRMSHRQAMIRTIYVYKVTVPILGSQKHYKFVT
jgi:hypothetical protein